MIAQHVAASQSVIRSGCAAHHDKDTAVLSPVSGPCTLMETLTLQVWAHNQRTYSDAQAQPLCGVAL